MRVDHMNRRRFTRLIGLGAAATAVLSNIPPALAGVAGGKAAEMYDADDLLEGFIHLPPSARPWTFYMWLDGNVSREGITSDLEGLKKIGIGGVVIMNLGLPPNEEILPGPVRFMTPQWRGLIKHAIAEANRLGLEVDMNNDDGWNSGGPWITPELGMQKLTWSETPVTGPAKITTRLERGSTTLDTYRDVAVLAVPSRKLPEIPSGAHTTVHNGPESWVQQDFGRVINAQSLVISNQKIKPGYVGPASCEIKVSDDGVHFRSVRTFETGWIAFTAPKSTAIRIGETSARYFRIIFRDPAIDAGDISFRMEAGAVVDHWQMKAGFSYIREHGGGSPLYAIPLEFPQSMNGKFPSAEQVINLTEMTRADGVLEWSVPQGEWSLLRIGYTPTGMKNGYATLEGKGLDSDKYNRKALEVHLAGMVDKLLDDAGELVGKSLTVLHTDSWESLTANWTADFPGEFRKRRGYDLLSWLPVMAGGRIIGSVEESERFLWDIRRTIADTFIDNHLKYFRELAHKRGLSFSSESSGRQQFLYDPIAFQVTSDIPTGEFWNTPQEQRPRPDCKAAASAAHVADRKIAGAEAFTQNQKNAGTWLESPFSLKALGDSAFCYGINRLYFHRMVAQPNPDQKPGMTWPKVGINFDVSQTWWNPAAAWVTYLTRCQYLLQQGRFVADVAVITEEGAPSSLIRQLHDPVAADDPYDTSTVTESVLRRYDMLPFLPPQGYDYDFIHPEGVREMEVVDGKLTLPHGMGYSVLVLPPGRRMTLRLAENILRLVKAGATLVGNKPQKSPSLSDFKEGDIRLQAIARELWGESDQKMRNVGRGRVFAGNATKEALEALGLLPDFDYDNAGPAQSSGLKIDYIHRQTETADIYFVSNQQNEKVYLNCRFRVSDRQPEYWFPDTGKTVPGSGVRANGRTELPLRLDPAGSVFVVFRKQAGTHTAGSHRFLESEVVQTVEGSWTVHFEPVWGGPEAYHMPKLYSWTDSSDNGVKHYSGTATYKKEIVLSRKLLKSGGVLFLDLGKVKEIASIRLNGKELGVLWKPPFRVEIPAGTKPGKSLLEIEITNLWPNRLIGDAGLPEKERLAKVNWNPYQPEMPLLESGLIGPVTLQIEK